MNRYLIRFFDLVLSLAGILVLSPLLILIAIWIKTDSKGSVLFRQVRVGRHNRNFIVLKFRTMRTGATSGGQLTVGERDERITTAGNILRKWKLDELPQLFNVLAGTMCMVGPRPEVRKYVQLYTPAQMHVLSVKPGITDYASIEYRDENAILGQAANPEEVYTREIMPHKILLNMKFIDDPSLKNYFSVIFNTLGRILS